MKHLAHMALTILLACATACGALAAPADIPASSLKVPELLPEGSVSTHITSEAAPGTGIAVSMIYPEKPRYKDGAPVVVVVPSGHAASGLDFSMHAAQAGFVEVRFAFPGGGKPGFTSGGIYDNRGAQSQQALRDVLLFAAGQSADNQGRTISDLVPIKVYNQSVGMVGWSNGGNITTVTLNRFASDLPFVGWLAFYESPLGALFYPANLGGPNDLNINKHYREGSAATGKCLVDYRKLTWEKTGMKNPLAHKKAGEPEIRGVLFFDENKNKHWDESFEYAFSYATDVGLDKQIYPPDVTAAAERLRIFDDFRPVAVKTPAKKAPQRPQGNPLLTRFKKKPTAAEQIEESESKEKGTADKEPQEPYWPDNVATLAESQAYFQERDGSLYIKDICRKFPDMLVTIFGSRVDHMQRQSDHPHISLQYNAWLHNKARWVRLNPDPIYVGQMAEMNKANFVDNKPNASLDATAIDTHLEPEGMVPDYLYMAATIAELSDRHKARRFDALETPIIAYPFGVPSTPPATASEPAKKDPAGKPPQPAKQVGTSPRK